MAKIDSEIISAPPLVYAPVIWDRFHEKGPNACFLKCPLHTASYALRIGVSIMEL